MPALLLAPITKWLGIALLVLTIAGALIAYGEHRKQLEWDAAIAKQAIASAKVVIAEAENTARVETKAAKKQDRTNQQTDTVKDEVKHYAETPHPPCVVTRDFERVLNDAISVPPATDAPGRADQADSRPAPAQVFSDVDRNADSGIGEDAVLAAAVEYARRFYALRDLYEGLVEWVETTYAVQRSGVTP